MSREKKIEEMVEFLNNRINVERNSYFGKGCITLPLIEADKILDILKGYRKQEWISVDERLPTCGELVLVSSMDLLTKKHGWFYLARYTNLQNDGVRFDDKRWLSEYGGIFGRVTHWMPLPEAPKMKGGAE